MVGPSGAGKSTYAAAHYDGADIVSSDVIRETMAGDMGISVPQEEIFARVRREVVRRLAAGQTAVVDATNLRREDRLANVRLAPDDMEIHYVVIERPSEEKALTAGERKLWVMQQHEATFAAELPAILRGDDLPHVRVVIPDATRLPTPPGSVDIAAQ